MKRKFGWIPDLPDARDHLYSLAEPLKALSPAVDMRLECPAVYDQGQLGSCTANAMGGALHFTDLELKKAPWVPSRLFIYYNTRSIEGTANYDSGATLRDTMKAVVNFGYCSEDLWPYKISQFAMQPVRSVYNDASSRKLTSFCYQRVDNTDINQIKQALSEHNPVVFGFSVYESFSSPVVAKTGVVPMPKQGERVVGGHAMLLVGYTDITGKCTFRNSWGQGWGDKGYGYMPYEYLTNQNMAGDFWVIKSVV